jgi:hypothetical protein
MTTEMVELDLADHGPPAVPAHPSGGAWMYCVYPQSLDQAFFSDSATELCGLLIPGYADIPDDDAHEQAVARILHIVRAQVQAQAAINAQHDLSVLTDEQRAVLTGSRDTQPRVDVWTAPVPLLLVTSFYQPYTDLPVPLPVPPPDFEGTNVIWLDPSDEYETLVALNVCGLIHLMVAG